jgi:hypothetical protein
MGGLSRAESCLHPGGSRVTRKRKMLPIRLHTGQARCISPSAHSSRRGKGDAAERVKCSGPAECARTDELELDGRRGRSQPGFARERPERATFVIPTRSHAVKLKRTGSGCSLRSVSDVKEIEGLPMPAALPVPVPALPSVSSRSKKAKDARLYQTTENMMHITIVPSGSSPRLLSSPSVGALEDTQETRHRHSRRETKA